MTVQCITCQHFTLRESPLARQGFGKCVKGKAYEFMSAVYERVCARFTPLDEEAAAKRRVWLEARK